MTQIPYELNNTLNRLCIDCEFVSDNSQHYIYRIHDKFLISNFWVIPNEELIKHTENSKTSYLEFKLISEEGSFQMLTASYKELGNGEFWHNSIGFSSNLYLSPGGEIYLKQILLALCNKSLSIKNIYLYTGYIDTVPESFNLGNKIINLNKDLNYCYLQQQNIQAIKFFNNTLLYILPLTKSLAIFATIFLSFSMSRLKKLDKEIPSFSLYISAETGARKTTLLTYLCDLTAHSKASISFEASLAAIDRTIKASRDIPVLIDDLRPPTSKSESLNFSKKLELIARSTGDRGSTRKLVSGHKVNETELCCIPIVTGEYVSKMSESSNARFFHISFEKADVNLKYLTEAKNNSDVYDKFLELFIQYTMENENFIDNLYKIFLHGREAFNSRLPHTHGRFIDSASWLYASVNSILDFEYKYNVIDKNAVDAISKSFFSFLELNMKTKFFYSNSYNTVSIFFSMLKEMLAANEIQISNISYEKNQMFCAINEKNLIFDSGLKGVVYLLTDKICSSINKYALKTYSNTLNLTGKKLRKSLAEYGYIVTDSSHSLTTQVTLNHHRIYVSLIKSADFYKLLKEESLNEF